MVLWLVNGKRKQTSSGLIQVAKVDQPLKDISALSKVQNQKPSLHMMNIGVEPQVFRSCIFSEEQKV